MGEKNLYYGFGMDCKVMVEVQEVRNGLGQYLRKLLKSWWRAELGHSKEQ